MTASAQAWVEVFGRLHPLLLHLPIGALLVLIALELFARVRTGEWLELGLRRFVSALVGLSAAVTATSGWILGSEPGYAGDDVFWWHRALGIALALCAVLTALLAVFDLRRGYGVFLALSCALLLGAGHRGAQLTHGVDFVTHPLRAQPAGAPAKEPPGTPKEPGANAPNWYASVIAPILEERCYRCHGNGKHKGGLALDDPAGLLQGGDSGAAVAPGDAAGSLLVQRLRLPLEHDEHMPPENVAQPSEGQIVALERWIEAGASLDAPAPEDVAPEDTAPEDTAPEDRTGEAEASEQTRLAPAGPMALPMALPPPPSAALAALEAEQVHAEVVEPRDSGLWVDFGPRSATDDRFVCAALEPLRDYLVELSLAGTSVGDGALAFAAELPRLERLNLAGTAVTDAGLAQLSGHGALRSLNVTRTAVSDGAAETLAALPALERVYAWGSRITAAGRARLAALRPELQVELGTHPTLQAPEVEAPVIKLVPTNSRCPVTASPVDSAFAIPHGDRVVGFCCADCLARFRAEPQRYPIAD